MLSANSRVIAVGVVLGSVGVAIGVAGSTANGATTANVPTTNVPATTTDSTDGLHLASDGDWTPPREAVLPTTTKPARASTLSARHRRPTHRRTAPANRRPPRASRAATRPSLSSDPRTLAKALVLRRGWDEQQWRCLDLLWTRESGWQVHDTNATSGAYGIPQSLPADKMAKFGSDWRDNPLTQIRWGLWYIDERYGTPCAAWDHSERYDYY